MSSRSFRLTTSVYISLDQNADTSNAIQLNLLVLVVSPVTQFGHVFAASIVFFVAFCKDCILVEAIGKSSAFVRLDPRIVVESPFDVSAVLVSVEPDIYFLLVLRNFGFDVLEANILGTITSLSWAMKSSRIFFGLSTMSTSLQ